MSKVMSVVFVFVVVVVVFIVAAVVAVIVNYDRGVFSSPEPNAHR